MSIGSSLSGLGGLRRLSANLLPPSDAAELAAYPTVETSVQPGLALTLRGVNKSFGSQAVLQSLDLDIEPGQFVAIVGRSGCGKSTLLRALAGLETVDDGILFSGPAPLSTRRRDIRLMFQDARLLPWFTVLDNIGLGLQGNWRTQALAALEEVGLAAHASKWPYQLSGGQRQRVALARALIHQPSLLLLDEPLGALDALTRLEMQALIERVWRTHRFTVVLVTHEVEEAVALGERVLVMEQGRVALDLNVDLERPRVRTAQNFLGLREAVFERILSR